MDTDGSSISRTAHIDRSVQIGRHVVIEDDVTIGKDTVLGDQVIIRHGTMVGENNRIHAGVQLGIEPQDYHFKGERSHCIVGNNNTIREYATISRATGVDNSTVIGNDNYIMTYVHVAHNVAIGEHNVIASGSQIAGHVSIGDFVNIGGLTGVHQYCRIGKYAMLGAKSYLNKDALPFLLVRGNPARVYGVNTRGLRQQGFDPDRVEHIKDIVNFLLRSPWTIVEGLERMKERWPDDPYVDEIRTFCSKSPRGILIKYSKLYQARKDF